MASYLSAGFSSVFFGGGTPSLFTREYGPILAEVGSFLQPEAEVTLEANPDDISPDSLSQWRDLGFNRLSIGVQTFAPSGLKHLGRQHSAAVADTAIAAALKVFPRLNVDLIYGWQGQGLALWQADLDRLLAHQVPHLSLYSLTYEGRTLLARRAQRGVLVPAGGDALADYYEAACAALAARGYQQEEVSNWSLPNHSCKHNWIYWQDHGYLGVGAGAHGYLPDPSGPGVRYAYPRQERIFTRSPLAAAAASPWLARYGVEVEPARTLDLWLTEVVGSALRTERGVDLNSLQERAGRRLVPTPVLAEGLSRGVITISTSGRLQLAAAEWFREVAWAVELLRSLV